MSFDFHPNIIRTLSELKDGEQHFAGGKGITLSRLLKKGYPVPDGFIIPPVAFINDEISEEAWEQVVSLLNPLRRSSHQVTFAVRSSAIAEDSILASFAGMFETVLNVQSDEEIRMAINTVHSSRYSERVKSYSQTHSMPPLHDMAVIIQRLIPANIAGVLFTADPVTGERTRMSGNFVYGLGDKLVSGEQDSVGFTIERTKYKYSGPAEFKRFARKLYKLASKLEKELGGPQDIEWAIFNGKIYILQSRPITTMVGFNPVTGEFNDSLTGDYVWSCVNVGEAMSVEMTPLTSSFMHMIYEDINIVPGYHSIGNIGGRAYLNSTVLTTMLRALRRNVKDIIKEEGGLRDEYIETMDQYIIPLPGVSFFSVLPRVFRMWRKQRAAMKNLAAFIIDNPGWCDDTCQQIQAIQNKEELVSLWIDKIKPRSFQSFWRVLATAWQHGEYTGKLRRQLTELVGMEDANVLLSNVSSHKELLASLGPMVGLAKVARGEIGRKDYMDKWGYRGPLEIELSAPRPFEDTAWFDKQLAMYHKTPVDVEAQLMSQKAKFNTAWEHFQARYPRKAKSMRRRLDKVAEASRTREAVRSEITKTVWVVRKWALRAGELTGIDNDIFFLTFEEVLNFLSGNDVLLSSIPARKRTYELYKSLPPYPMVIRGRFNPVLWAEDKNRRSDVFDSHGLLENIAPTISHDNVILGMPGSSGRVEGIVYRLDNPDDGDKLEPGGILVTSQTNIGWTPFFPKAKAIVTDIGAPLSHAAVIARELGIPAVVNCGNATMRLHNGDRIRVDGSQGIVEILGG